LMAITSAFFASAAPLAARAIGGTVTASWDLPFCSKLELANRQPR
jgi:hypothetical protein